MTLNELLSKEEKQDLVALKKSIKSGKKNSKTARAILRNKARKNKSINAEMPTFGWYLDLTGGMAGYPSKSAVSGYKDGAS